MASRFSAQGIALRGRWLLVTTALAAAAFLGPVPAAAGSAARADCSDGRSRCIAFHKPAYFPGETVTVTGERWWSRQDVYLRFSSERPGFAPRTLIARTDENGFFRTALQLPADAPLGTYWVEAWAPPLQGGTLWPFEVRPRPPASAPPRTVAPTGERARARAVCRSYRRNLRRMSRRAAVRKRAGCLRRARRLPA